MPDFDCIVIGAGPAGLMAAEMVSGAGFRVCVIEQMPSPARKFLMAGRGGLNLTHAMPLDEFLTRYEGDAASTMSAAITTFPPDALRDWCHGLGVETFVGSSGRIFPKSLKASPLLRAWLARLRANGVELRVRQRWSGLSRGADGGFEITCANAAGEGRDGDPAGTHAGSLVVSARAVILGVGGASWPRLGSDGAWAQILAHMDIQTAPFQPSNCGVRIAWSDQIRSRFAGVPVKRIAARCGASEQRGELVLTETGLEGGAVYALSPALRSALTTSQDGTCRIEIDLRPDLTQSELAQRLSRARGRASLSNHWRKAAGLHPVQIALAREGAGDGDLCDAEFAAALIKAVPLTVTGLAGLERAISSVGGLGAQTVGADFMLRALPGVFAAGEMLDWDAPTGGFLLQACFASGRAAGLGTNQWLAESAAR